MAETGAAKRRVLTRDLDPRVSALELKLGELADRIAELEESISKLGELAQQVASLADRVNKIANLVAQSPLRA